MKNKLKQFKEKYSHIILLLFTIIMFLVSMLTSFCLGVAKGKNSSLSSTTQQRFTKRANLSDNYVVGNKYFYKVYANLTKSAQVAYNFTYDSIEVQLEPIYYSYYGIDYNGLYLSFNDIDFEPSNVILNLSNFFNSTTSSKQIQFQYNYNDVVYNLVFDASSFTFSYSYMINNDYITTPFAYTFKSANTGVSYGLNSSSTLVKFKDSDSSVSFITGANVTLSSNTTSDFTLANYMWSSYRSNLNFRTPVIKPSDLENAYNNGYETGLVEGEKNANDSLYNKGYQDGVNNSTNPLIGFDDTYINMLYQGETDFIVEDSNINLPINGYTYDFNSYVSSLKSTREDEGNGNDNGVAYIDLYDFSPFIDNQLEFNLVGFYKVEYIYNDLSLGIINISNYRDYSTIILNNNKLVESIKLYFYATDNVQNGYILNLYTTNTYQDGYQNGFNQGLSQGAQNGFKEGYTEGREEGKTEGYNQGYDIGYNSGYNVGNSETCKLNTLVFSIADIPVYILSKLLGFEIFGFNVFVALCSVITIILIIFLVKKFSK